MDLETHYEELWDDSIRLIKKGDIQTDPYLNATNDSRFGLTLLARPSKQIRQNIRAFREDVRQTAPRQYFYPDSDLHLTILSIVSCEPNFSVSPREAATYTQLIQQALADAPPVHIKLKGITASHSAIMICGYPDQNSLNPLRNRLRKTLKESPLYQTIDKRYILKTAHFTVLRFRTPLNNAGIFAKRLRIWKDASFGTLRIKQMELVYNDWYQRASKVRSINTFDLK